MKGEKESRREQNAAIFLFFPLCPLVTRRVCWRTYGTNRNHYDSETARAMMVTQDYDNIYSYGSPTFTLETHEHIDTVYII